MNNHADVELWGTGFPLREFLHVDDLGQAVCLALQEDFDGDLYNVGSGNEIEIKDLALLIQKTVGHKGNVLWDTSKPDGTPKKLMDSSRLNKKGWRPTISLSDGINETYNWFVKNRQGL